MTPSPRPAETPQSRAQRSVYRCSWNLKVNVIAASFLVGRATRMQIYRRAGIAIETDKVQPGCWFFGHDVTIGAGTWIAHRCYFDSAARIAIGRNCDPG